MVVRWLRGIFSSSKKLIGYDQFGNSYYEVLKGSGKMQRSFEASTKTSHENYKDGDVPHEWEAWLRGKRTNPPSTEEIENNLHYKMKVQTRAVRKTAEDDQRQAQAYADGLIAREAPVSVSSKQTVSGTAQPGTDADFQPDSWTPGSSSVDPDTKK